jgi:hypothetical protein
VVKALPDGRWEPKQAFAEVARRYARPDRLPGSLSAGR